MIPLKLYFKVMLKCEEKRYQHQLGFSLLEVLIAWSISATVMLGMLSLANELLIDVHHRYLQAIAVARLQEMLERLRTNADVEHKNREFNLWNSQNPYLLPQGEGQYTCDESIKTCSVCINWQEKQSEHLTMTAFIS